MSRSLSLILPGFGFLTGVDRVFVMAAIALSFLDILFVDSVGVTVVGGIGALGVLDWLLEGHLDEAGQYFFFSFVSSCSDNDSSGSHPTCKDDKDAQDAPLPSLGDNKLFYSRS